MLFPSIDCVVFFFFLFCCCCLDSLELLRCAFVIEWRFSSVLILHVDQTVAEHSLLLFQMVSCVCALSFCVYFFSIFGVFVFISSQQRV